MKNLGDILKSERKRNRLTFAQVYQKIKIHPKYIKALEENDYEVFDGALHARGFLKIYAQLLNLDVDQIIAIWRREYGFKFSDALPSKEESSWDLKDLKEGFVLTPQKIFSALGILVAVIFLSYLFFQYKTYQGPPSLDIYYPENNQVVTDSLLDITGKTDIDARLLVNGEELLINPDGSFALSVNLKEGLNNISVTSISKLDKKSERILTVIYRPLEQDPSSPKIPETSESTEAVQPPEEP